MSTLRRRIPEVALLLLPAILIFVIALRARVSDANSDPRLSLMVPLALLEQGTLRLDAYRELTDPPLDAPENRQSLVELNGHLFYFFPIGTALMATPFVAAALWLGWDLTDIATQNQLQNGLAALFTAAVFILLFLLLRLLLPLWPALGFGLVFMAGTTLVSALGSALWSHHGAALTSLVILILLAGRAVGRWSKVPGALVGLLLFLAFLSRPGMAIFAVLVLSYLAGSDRRAFFGAAGVAGALFAGFLLFSRLEFGAWMPPYYAVWRLDDYRSAPLGQTLYGQLLSPSRGLLIYSPFLVPALGLVALRWRALRPRKLVLLVMLWAVATALVAARAVEWWGGWSFGPRLLTDPLPGLALLTALAWREAPLDGRARRAWLALFAATALGAVAIHVLSGLYNVHSQRWNGRVPPDVNRYPQVVFDWRYPQFLATAESVCARNAAWIRDTRPAGAAISTGEELAYDDPRVAYPGWSAADAANGRRWTECDPAGLLFNLAEPLPTGAVVLNLAPHGVAQVDIWLNGADLGRHSLFEPRALRLALLPGTLRAGGNELVIRAAGAGEPSATPPYSRGVALHSWRLDGE